MFCLGQVSDNDEVAVPREPTGHDEVINSLNTTGTSKGRTEKDGGLNNNQKASILSSQ